MGRRKPKDAPTSRSPGNDDAGLAGDAGSMRDAQEPPPLVPPGSPLAHDPLPPGAAPGALPSLSRVMSVAMLMLGIVAVGLLFYKVMAGFFVPLFLAALLVVLFRPVHKFFSAAVGDRPRTAALATTTVILGVVLLPVMIVLAIAGTQLAAMVSKINPTSIQLAVQNARQQFSLNLSNAEHFRRLNEDVATIGDDDSIEKRITKAVEIRRLVVFLARESKRTESKRTEATDAPVSVDPLPAERRKSILAAYDAALDSLGDYEAHLDSIASEEPAEERLSSGRATADSAALSRRQTDARESDARESDAQTADLENAETGGNPRPPSRVFDPLAVDERTNLLTAEAATAILAWRDEVLGGPVIGYLRMAANPAPGRVAELVTGFRGLIQDKVLQLSTATGGVIAQMAIGLGIMVLSVYFFLIDGPAMTERLMRLSPLDDDYERQLLLEFDRTSRAVVLASILSALAQGVLAAIAFYVLDFNSVVLLFLVTCLMALVPFLGAASVWVPCALWLGAVDQDWYAALGLAVFGTVVISSIDNVIKVFVLHGRSQLHPLFALLSVLGGVAVFGPIGILVGPMVVVFLQTLLEILNQELRERDESDANTPQPETGKSNAAVSRADA